MINYDHVTKETISEHSENRPEISDHRYTVLIIGVSGSGKQMNYSI